MGNNKEISKYFVKETRDVHETYKRCNIEILRYINGELTSIPKNLKYGTKCSGTKRKDIQLNRNGTVSVPYNLLLYRSIAASFPFNIKTPLRVKRHH